jgi:hypothetical protein
MNGARHPWQRPILPQFVSYFMVLIAYTAFTVALLYILLDSPT